ncbi:hypothetical protein CCP3SC1AL1_320017 [Gammaproteobacteria bacterium]
MPVIGHEVHKEGEIVIGSEMVKLKNGFGTVSDELFQVLKKDKIPGFILDGEMPEINDDEEETEDVPVEESPESDNKVEVKEVKKATKKGFAPKAAKGSLKGKEIKRR